MRGVIAYVSKVQYVQMDRYVKFRLLLVLVIWLLIAIGISIFVSFYSKFGDHSNIKTKSRESTIKFSTVQAAESTSTNTATSSDQITAAKSLQLFS